MPKARILIIEDHDLDRRLTTLDLVSAGYTVYEAPDASTALRHLVGHTFDLIILDIGIKEMDGLTFLRGLQRTPEFAQIPVVMVTARDDVEAQLEAMSAGAVGYIVKPSHRETLVRKISSVLEQVQRSD